MKFFGLDFSGIKFTIGNEIRGGGYDQNRIIIAPKIDITKAIPYKKLDLDKIIKKSQEEHPLLQKSNKSNFSSTQDNTENKRRPYLDEFTTAMHEVVSKIIKKEIKQNLLPYYLSQDIVHIKKYTDDHGEKKEFIGIVIDEIKLKHVPYVGDISPENRVTQIANNLHGFITKLDSPEEQLGSDFETISKTLQSIHDQYSRSNTTGEALANTYNTKYTEFKNIDNILKVKAGYVNYNKPDQELDTSRYGSTEYLNVDNENIPKSELDHIKDNIDKISSKNTSEILKESTNQSLKLNLSTNLDKQEQRKQYNKIEGSINKVAKKMAKEHVKDFLYFEQIASHGQKTNTDKSFIEKYYTQHFADILNKYASALEDPVKQLGALRNMEGNLLRAAAKIQRSTIGEVSTKIDNLTHNKNIEGSKNTDDIINDNIKNTADEKNHASNDLNKEGEDKKIKVSKNDIKSPSFSERIKNFFKEGAKIDNKQGVELRSYKVITENDSQVSDASNTNEVSEKDLHQQQSNNNFEAVVQELEEKVTQSTCYKEEAASLGQEILSSDHTKDPSPATGYESQQTNQASSQSR